MGRIRTIKPELYGSQVLDPSERSLPYGQFILYRIYDLSGSLLYVGITGNPEGRFTAHRRKSQWWPSIASVYTEIVTGLRLALRIERDCIAIEKPKFNKRSVKK